MVSNLLKFHPTDEYAYCDPTPTETITPSPTTIASPLGTATETPASPDMPTPLSFNGPAVFSIQYFRPQLALLAPKTPTFTVTATPTVTDTPTMTPTATDTPTSTTTSTSAATHTAIPIPPEPVTIDYAYDPLHRLTSANYSTGDYYHYTYDSVGNRLTEESKVKGLLSAVDYVYDEANRLTSVDNVAYTWDANGNLLNDGVNTYTYDSANRLTAVNGPSSTVEYTYNGLGDRLIQNNVQYTLDLNAGLTQVLGDGEHTYLYGNGRISQTGNSTEYFLGDALGSVRQLTNEEAEITLTKAYEPYGEEAWSYGEGQTDYGFAAEWADTNGLIHLRARHYNPLDGRFFQKDPWDGDANLPATFNPYLYALNNPLIYTDPSGEIPQLLALMGIGFVAGVALGAIVGIADRGWALSGQCGCDIQEIAQSTGDFEWIGYHALVGGLIGGSAPVLAAIAAASPLGTIAIGGIGVVLGGKDLYNTAQIIINEQKGHPTWCTGIRAAVDILIIIFGGATAIKGWQAGVAAWRSSGSLLSWVAPGATGAGLQPPNWVRSAGAFVNWMKNLQREYLLTGRIMSSSEIDSIIAIARGYRVAIRLDPPHAKPPWNIPHLNIGAEGQAHIPVPPGYKLP